MQDVRSMHYNYSNITTIIILKKYIIIIMCSQYCQYKVIIALCKYMHELKKFNSV